MNDAFQDHIYAVVDVLAGTLDSAPVTAEFAHEVLGYLGDALRARCAVVPEAVERWATDLSRANIEAIIQLSIAEVTDLALPRTAGTDEHLSFTVRRWNSSESVATAILAWCNRWELSTYPEGFSELVNALEAFRMRLRAIASPQEIGALLGERRNLRLFAL